MTDPEKQTEASGLIAALAKAQGAFGEIVKNRTVTIRPRDGAPYSFDYADLASIIAATRTALSTNGLAIVTKILAQDRGLVLVSSLCHQSGEAVDSLYPLPNTVDPKQLGSAITYGRRYCMSSLLNIAAEDDDDGTMVEPEAAPKPARAPAQPKPSIIQPKAPAPEQIVSTKQLDYLFNTVVPKAKWTNEQVQQYMIATKMGASAKTLTKKNFDLLAGVITAVSFTVAMAEVAPNEPDVDLPPKPAQNQGQGGPP